MGLDVIETGDLPLVGIGAFHGQCLSLLTGRPEALPLAVAGHSDTADHGTDPIAVGDRAGERLDDQRHIALGGHQTIGPAAERTRSAVAHRLGGREENQAIRLAVRGTADDRLVNTVLLEGTGGDGHRLQRRRTGGIDDKVRTVKPQRLANDLGGPERPQIELLSRFSPRVPVADGCCYLIGHHRGLGAEELPCHINVAQERSAAVDAGGVDVVANPGAAAGVPHVDSRAAAGGHRERIEAGVAAGQ